MTAARPRTLQHDWPPPSVVGASPWPYPPGPTPWESMTEAITRIAAQRTRSGVAELPFGDVVTVRPAWLDVPLFTRSGSDGWVLHPDGAKRIVSAAIRLGLHQQMPHRDGWCDATRFRHRLEGGLAEYLTALAWWEPDAVPRASGALESLFAQLLNDGRWTWDEQFAGEREAEEARRRRRDDDEYLPWRDRASRREVEQMIAVSGRVDPYCLRPLVLITENAGRRQWWYGGWGVYDVDATGAAGALLAVYGKHARHANMVVWMTPSEYTGPQPSDDDVRWYGHSFDDWGDRHADVLCAVTGVSLYEGTRGRIADAPRPREAFLTGTPTTLTALSEHRDVLERIDGLDAGRSVASDRFLAPQGARDVTTSMERPNDERH